MDTGVTFTRKEKRKGLNPDSHPKMTNNSTVGSKILVKLKFVFNITRKQIQVAGNLAVSKFNPALLFKLRVVWLPAKL